MIDIPERIVNLPRSGIRELMEIALRDPEVIRLEMGEPHFPTPTSSWKNSRIFTGREKSNILPRWVYPACEKKLPIT